MFQQTPQKRVLFPRTLTKVMVGVFVATFLLTFLAGLFYGAQPAKAATNSTLNFQARLETASGAIVPDGYYNVEFKLYNVNSAGSALWTETYYDANGATAGSDNRVQVRNGYLTANLGSQTAFPGTINWDQDLWVTMNIGGTTQTATPTWDGEMNPRLKLTGVPYAFRAGQLALQTGVNTSTLGFATQTGARNILLPDESGTICIQSSSNCGFAVSSGSANYIQNGTSPQTASFNVTGDGTIGGNLSVGGQQVITSGRVLQNVTANTSILTAGTLGIARGGTGVSTTPTNGQLLIGNGAGYSLATLGVSGGLTVTNSAGGINIGTDSTICTTNGNCVGTGSAGSSIGGSGSTNTIAMFTGAGLIGNSIISQTGTSSIDVSGNILATGINVNNVSTNGTTRIDASGVLQNVTTDASILTSGTIASARITGSYTGITGVGTLNGLSIAANNTFTNSGSTLNTAVALSNFTASAAIGTAAATVNVATAFTVNQTTASIILTLPSPTTTTAGRIVYVSNIGTASFTMYNVVVSPGTTATYLWNGTAWTSAGIDGSGANYIQNQSGSTQTGNFKISGTGVAATLHAATFDAASVSALNIGTTNANAIIIGNTTNTATASVIATTTLNLGNNANNKTVNIGATGSTANTTTVNIATSTGAAQTVNIGSTNGASATTIQGGTGNINLNTNSATASVIVRSNTNSTTAFQVQNAAGASVLLVDTSGQKVNINQSNLAIAGLSAPGTPTFTAGSNSSGSLSGSSSTTYYYKVSAVNGSGESAGSTEASFTGASFTPISAPGAATAALNATAGNLTGTYSYVVTFVTANGETTAGTASNSVTASAQTIDLSSIPLGPSGTTARKIYRTAAGGSTYMLNTTINDNTTTTLTADNVIDGSLGATPPASNTARTNTNTLSVSFTAATGATSYKVYRGTSSGAENVYFTTTTSPFSDTGAAGTAGTPLSLASNGTITTTGTINTNVFTGSALTFGSAAAATISSATNQNLTLQAAGTGSLALLSGSGGISIGSTGSSTSSSTVRIADTTSGTGTQAVTIGSSANAGNALTLEAGNTGKIQIGNSTAAHTIQIGAGGTAAQSVTIGSTSSSSVTTIQAGTGNLNLVTNSASAGVIVKAQSDTATAFQVQASNSSPILNIDTTDTNLLAGLNGGFESNPLTSWVAKNGGSVARSTAQRYTGNASGQITTTATAGSGIQVPYTFAANTQYTLSLYARLSSGSMSTFVIGRQDVSGTDVNGLTGQTLSANGWTRLTWTFTTGGTITSSNIYVNQSDATVRAGTMFIDSVQLETGASATAYGGGNIQMNATVTSPFSIRNTSDSTTAFTIQNATGTTNLMNVDTLNNTINLGANLQVAGMTVLTTGRVLQNVTTDASILTSGTIASARISGSYTGITGVGTLNGLSVATNNTFTNAGSTLNSAVALSNFAANAAIGTAAATVDGVTTFTINQTTANITLTMPNPTATTAGRIVYISNIGTASFTMYNVVVSPGNTATYLWNGSAWTSAGIDGSGANYIQNQSGSTQSANFKISGTGVANLLQASTFDAASATTMNLGTTNATGVNLATNAIAHAISIGTGAAAQTVTIGSTNTTSTTTLQAGSGSVNLFGNTSSLTTATARVLQGGTGDALLEFNNSGLGKSFYIGQDTSSGGNFIINSSTSATASTVSTPTFVQSITVGSTASATTTASTFTTTAGNLIVVSLSFASSGTTFTCTDNRGDTFSNAAQVTNSGQTAGICYAPNVAGGSTTVTVTYGAASTFRAIILSEYSGVATSNPVDVTSVNTGTATTATDNVTSNSATTTQTGNLIVGLVDDITGNAVVSAGTGYTPRQAS
ncbi:MAG: exported protein of unknown function, partial [Candidatus Saccharibacteria bacterium]|nr:exported protein of unknown function [Candidatus Saccharibacteria bacterium]